MNNAVALVQAYLYVNGFFTVTEYPVVERDKQGEIRSATDLDVLALRYPGGGMLVPSREATSSADHSLTRVDPALGIDQDRINMLVAEVKEGQARFNRAMFRPPVLRAALTRFGCCEPEEIDRVVDELLASGRAHTRHEHRLRLGVFGMTGDLKERERGLRIGLDHVREYLDAYIDRHWNVFRQANFSDPGLSWLMTLKKTER